MKIFVTGGTGFIGSNFVNEALARQHSVTGLRRNSSCPPIPMATEPIWLAGALDSDLGSMFRDIDVFVHLAAHTPNPPYGALDECFYWNVTSTIKLMQQAVAAGVKKFIIVGSCFEYGSAAQGQWLVHPNTELRPSETYPISKAVCSMAALGMARYHGLRLQVLRLFQVYGEGERSSRLWPSLCVAARCGSDFQMSAGTQIKDFIAVHQVAKSLCDAIEFDGVEEGKPHVRNIGTGQGTSVLDFAQKCWREMGATGKLLPGMLQFRSTDVPRLVANIHDVHVC